MAIAGNNLAGLNTISAGERDASSSMENALKRGEKEKTLELMVGPLIQRFCSLIKMCIHLLVLAYIILILKLYIFNIYI
jgi:hypothetical protein